MTEDEQQRLASARRHVAKGATWLDEKEPGWPWLIELPALNLADGCYCVLGQIGYHLAVEDERCTVSESDHSIESDEMDAYISNGYDYLIADWLDGDDDAASRLGFDRDWDEAGHVQPTYSDLQTAWVEAIRQRTAPAEESS